MTILFFLRLLVWRHRKPIPIFCALLQDAFVASELYFLPQAIAIPLLIYQWLGILFAARLEMRLTPSLFSFLRSPRSLFGSARDLKLFQWAIPGIAAILFCPYSFSHPIFLVFAPLAALWSRRLDSVDELQASNPLFYLQWKWLIHPPEKRAPFLHQWKFHERTEFPDPTYPIYRKTAEFLGPKQIDLHLDRPNVMFIFLESFRAENVGALGASPSASPHFDALAKKGILFTQCSATGQQTFQTVLSSLFGVQPCLNTVFMQRYADISLHGLPEIMKSQGYRTAVLEAGYTSFDAFLLFFRNRAIDLILGAEDLGGSTSPMSWGILDETLFSAALDWMKEHRNTPSFSSLFTITNHHPWEVPPNWNYQAPDHLPPVQQRFHSTFAYTDACLGRFIENLRKENLLENTLLVITGDHGQGLGERFGNGANRVNLFQHNIHVPLLLYAEGRVKPQVIDTPCSHLDIPLTLLDLLGLEGPHHFLGRSLLRDFVQPSFFSMAASVPRWGCRLGPWKWTGLSNGKEETLHNLSNDPKEEQNIVLTHLEKGEELKQLAAAHFSSAEELFRTRRWAPAVPYSEQFLGPKIDTTDDELEPLLTRSCITINLKPCSKLTDRSLQLVAQKIGPSLRHIAIPDSPFLTDEGLYALANGCPNIVAFNACGCPRLTHLGIEKILEQCPLLKSMSLDDLDQVTSLNPRLDRLTLRILYLGEDIQIAPSHFLSLLHRNPNLSYLNVNTAQFGPSDYLLPAEKLNLLYLYQARTIEESHILQLLERNQDLWRLELEDCETLTQLRLPSAAPLQLLTLKNCPELTTLQFDGLILNQLIIRNCPRLTGEFLQALDNGHPCRLVISGCPLISKEELIHLRSRGLEVF